MDLSAVKPATQRLDVIHPGSRQKTGLVMEVASAESDPVKRVKRRHLDKATRNRRHKITADQIEEQVNDTAVAAVVGWKWEGDAEWGGKKLEFSPENVAAVLRTDWIRAQVLEVMEDEAGFFTN